MSSFYGQISNSCPIVLGRALFLFSALGISTPTISVADEPSIEVLGDYKIATIDKDNPSAFLLVSDDSVLSINGNTLNIQSSTNGSRAVELPEEISASVKSPFGENNIKSSFALRPDGVALVAPNRLNGHVACPYFIYDTISGSKSSGTYDGVFFNYSKGEQDTFCHEGIATNPGAEQFALAPTASKKDIFLISYNASRTTLSPSFDEAASLVGRIVYLSKDKVVAGYNINETSDQKFILFDLENSSQSTLPISQPDSYFELIKSVGLDTLILQRGSASSQYSGLNLSAMVSFNVSTSLFSLLRDPGTVSGDLDNFQYRDAAFESSAGSSPLFRDGLFTGSCDENNSKQSRRSIDVCVSFGERGTWEPLQCFFPKTSISKVPSRPIGVTSDGRLVVGMQDRIAAISFPSITGEEFTRYCSQLELLPSSSCMRYLSTEKYPGSFSFKSTRSRRACSVKLQLKAGENSLGKGQLVTFLRRPDKRRARALMIGSRRTNRNGNVTFRLRLKDFIDRGEANSIAIFRFKDSETIRRTELWIQP